MFASRTVTLTGELYERASREAQAEGKTTADDRPRCPECVPSFAGA